MKLWNKKGFILVETLIVTLFVATLFILIYQNLVPSIGEYETMSTYDDIDSIYASNLFKQSLLRYGNTDYIDLMLEKETYLNITDCKNTEIYKSSQYCEKIKKSLSISKDDYIFVTPYNISEFREVVNNSDFFDSGKLSNFRTYLNTISDTDDFYTETETSPIQGKYRLFITRTVTNMDQTTTVKYANIGIYDGKYKRYNMGDSIIFAPGSTTGEMKFYVLKDSTSFDSTVTLIPDRNIGNPTSFNLSGTTGLPTAILNIIYDQISPKWDNVVELGENDKYISDNGYTISYSGERARLLEPNDIYEIFGSKIENNYFNSGSSFPITFSNDNSLSFLYSNLSGSKGYWMVNMTTDNSETAWAVQEGKIAPIAITNSTDIGVRPVIIVKKENLPDAKTYKDYSVGEKLTLTINGNNTYTWHVIEDSPSSSRTVTLLSDYEINNSTYTIDTNCKPGYNQAACYPTDFNTVNPNDTDTDWYYEYKNSKIQYTINQWLNNCDNTFKSAVVQAIAPTHEQIINADDGTKDSWLYLSPFWTQTRGSLYEEFIGCDMIDKCLSKNISYSDLYGVRPVIVVKKDELPVAKTYKAYNIGDQVTISVNDNSKWHVIENSSTSSSTVTLLSDYEINPSTYTFDTSCNPGSNDPSCNPTDFNTVNPKDTDTGWYYQYENSKVKTIINNWLQKSSSELKSAITQADAPTLDQITNIDNGYRNDWLFSSPFWTQTESITQTANTYGDFFGCDQTKKCTSNHISYNTWYGVRVVITISKDKVK